MIKLCNKMECIVYKSVILVEGLYIKRHQERMNSSITTEKIQKCRAESVCKSLLFQIHSDIDKICEELSVKYLF